MEGVGEVREAGYRRSEKRQAMNMPRPLPELLVSITVVTNICCHYHRLSLSPLEVSITASSVYHRLKCLSLSPLCVSISFQCHRSSLSPSPQISVCVHTCACVGVHMLDPHVCVFVSVRGGDMRHGTQRLSLSLSLSFSLRKGNMDPRPHT